MALDFSLAGKTYDSVDLSVDAADIRRHAVALGDGSPRNPRCRVGPNQVVTGSARLRVGFTSTAFSGFDVDAAVRESGGRAHLLESTRPDGTVVMSGIDEARGS